MEKIDLKDVEDGYYRIESNGARLHLWVQDGVVTEVNVHVRKGDITPETHIYTKSKMSKQTRKLGPGMNDVITLKVKE